MKNEKGPLSWLARLRGSQNGEADKKKKASMYSYALIVLVAGLGIMMVSNVIGDRQGEQSSEAIPAISETAGEAEDIPAFGKKNTSAGNSIKDYERGLENQMKDALEAINGVDDVTVVINVDASEKKVFEKNRVTQKQVTDETDQDGGKRVVEDSSTDEQLVIIRSGEKEVPLVLETKKPKIRGVLVVAKGAGNIQVKKWIIESVQRSLDVPSHRIAVMPKK
ncbi:stage III sporulation protein AG [Peribacillus saganii]|uniref:Stage III sporulation protein AG n=1 Tax=Peribacillus saganii TaxID=2303992 RepID=A0A372LPB4_9BACI|nr:stage III sporulation protein AG [Peribacillus saganii]RFU69790.1 stage III sporulation protein AG [Peribacillus saganii]